MLGAMQDWELRVSLLIDHAAREHGAREIVTSWGDGTETRTTWAGVRRDALKMVQALQRLGIRKGDRVATLAMNHSRHLVAWYGATGAGGVLHTINPRLFDDQLEYIANHAEDRVLIYDAAFEPIVDRLNTIVNAALKEPAIADKLNPQGIVPRPMNAAEYKKFVESETEKFGKIIVQANIKVTN